MPRSHGSVDPPQSCSIALPLALAPLMLLPSCSLSLLSSLIISTASSLSLSSLPARLNSPKPPSGCAPPFCNVTPVGTKAPASVPGSVKLPLPSLPLFPRLELSTPDAEPMLSAGLAARDREARGRLYGCAGRGRPAPAAVEPDAERAEG
jgi:hypothetical protein